MTEAHFSPIEIGLLTVADRRGAVRIPRKLDERNDPANIERLLVLRRLVELGMLEEIAPADDTVLEIEFSMTDTGRTALVATDGPARRTHS